MGDAGHAGACGRLRWWVLSSSDVLAVPDSPPAVVEFAKREEARAVVGLIAASSERFCTTTGAYPQSLEELIRFSESLPRRARCRFAERHVVDPWGRPYILVGGESHPRIGSAGPDGRDETPDDIGLPEPDNPEGEALSASVCVEPAAVVPR
jgi:hypothetical protein